MSQSQAPKVIKPDNIGETYKDWLRTVDEPDRVFTRNKKIEVVFLVEAVNAILPRTEGVEDITLAKIPGTDYEVPVILPEKLQAVARRNMLSYLRDYYNRRGDEVKNYLKKLSEVFVPIEDEEKKKSKKKGEPIGYIKAGEYLQKGVWNCFIQPPAGEGTDVGMDGFCPACALFGTLLDNTKVSGVGNISVGLKSRVEFDPAFAISDRKVSVVPLTHNKVSDGLSWTGQSLFREFHVVPGTIFVGKVTLEDVTEQELKAFLAILATVARLGGRERVFGGVRTHLVGIRGGSYETTSALELAKKLIKKYSERLPDVEEVVIELKQEIANKGFATDMNQEEFRKLVDDDSTWRSLWESTLEYDRQVLLRVLQLQGVQDKYKEAEAWIKKIS
ncbi:MAG: type I-D CRISPR-associated protein Cas7/Csc2 [Fervidicoccaceae archaeon]